MRYFISVLFLVFVSGAAFAGPSPRYIDPAIVDVLEMRGSVEVIINFRAPPPPTVRERSRRTQQLGEIREHEFNQVWESFEEHMGREMENLEVTGASLVSLRVSATVHERRTLERIRQFPRLHSVRQAQEVLRIREEKE
jgi:hypothetical protein